VKIIQTSYKKNIFCINSKGAIWSRKWAVVVVIVW